jgi:hypothetical protein
MPGFSCYAWQIDGTSFSKVIVLKAIRRSAALKRRHTLRTRGAKRA